MAKIIGQDVEVAVKQESTRMTIEDPASGDWIARGEFSVKDIKQVVEIMVNEGRITTRREIKPVHYEAEVTITLPLERKHLGKFLKGYYGTINTTADTPESGVHSHALSILHTGYVPSFTISVVSGSKQYQYAGGIITSMKLDISTDNAPMLTVTFLTKKAVSDSGLTPAYATTSYFSPVDVAVYLPASYSNIASANAIDIRALSIEWTREPKRMKYLGNDSYSNVIVADFDVKVSIEKDFDTETYYTADTGYAKDDHLNNTTRALRLELTDTDVTLGASSNPVVTVDIPAGKMMEYEESDALKEIVGEKYDFVPFDNGANDMSLATLVNDVASY